MHGIECAILWGWNAIMYVSSCKIRVFLALFLLNATLVGGAWAQDAPAPLYTPPPAWNAAPEAPPGFAPAPAPPQQPGQQPFQQAQPGVPPAGDDGSYFVPVQPAPGFDYFEEEDGGAGGYDGGQYAGDGDSGGGGSHVVKDSMKFVDRPARDTCKKWGNSFLGPTTFTDRTRCDAELDRKVDQGYASIDDLYDKVELYKLKKVIKGELKSRAEAKQYSINFDNLRQTLSEAARKGCSCQD
jgi:hypothetical protein